MSAIKVTPTREKREIRAEVIGAPDLPKTYTSLTIRPRSIHVSWTRQLHTGSSPEPWRVDTVVLYGPRVLKSGRLGESWSDVSMSYHRDRPGWLNDLLADMEPSNAGAREVTS